MTVNKIILGFVGDLASGKGTIAKYLREKYNINSYRYSTMLRDMLARVYLPDSRDNMQKLSTFLRQNFSEDIMSKVIAKDVENDQNPLVVVEGIRRPADIIYLKANLGFHLIYITAKPKIRWERAVKRNENPGDDKKTLEKFLQDEQAEAESKIHALGATAKYTINNDGDFTTFYAQIETIIQNIKNADTV